jgi:hypothetical protein
MRVVHLTEEAPMVSIPKVVGVLSCSFLLCLGLSQAAQAENVASAADDMKAGQPGRQGGQAGLKGEQDKLKAGRMIEGQVLRVEGDNYFVKGQDGKEVRLHTDQTTQKTGNIRQGDLIEAEVNDQNHALSIRSAK